MEPVKLLAQTAAVHNAVKNAVHFTSPVADRVPVLAAAHLVIRDGNLILEATDRYKLIQIKVQDLTEQIESREGSEDELPRNADLGIIPVDVLKSLEQSLRAEARSKQNPHVILTVNTPKITVQSQSELSEQTYQLLEDEEYPNIDSLFWTEFPDDASPAHRVAMQHLQAVSKVQHARHSKNHQTVEIYSSKGAKPLAIYWTANDEVWAQGLLMPVRRENYQPSKPRHF